MISPASFYDLLRQNSIDFFTGVPDSLLKSICAYISDHTDATNNIIAANEGGAVGLATGYHLATGKIPLVYLQNSGIGNCVNPFLSLTDPDVYSIPMLVMIGWRGEPGVHDEPQHIKQGKVTLDLLKSLDVDYLVLPDSLEAGTSTINEAIQLAKEKNKPVALVVKKGTFEPYSLKRKITETYRLKREDAIESIVEKTGDGILISTTGMASRELFEIREKLGHDHSKDFLTVGSMGHTNQIALGIALQNPQKNVYCLDGDGALLMHMGSLGIIGASNAQNYKHILLNNGAHDSVGGQPTVGFNMDFCTIAKSAGYKTAVRVDSLESLAKAMDTLNSEKGPGLIEVMLQQGARKDLGRPTLSPQQNKKAFMDNLKK